MAKIAQAEGAEAGCRRARDLEGLRNAVTDKLTHQRNFVVWRDNRPKSVASLPLAALQLVSKAYVSLSMAWRRLKGRPQFDSRVVRFVVVIHPHGVLGC